MHKAAAGPVARIPSGAAQASTAPAQRRSSENRVDVYFSADVETDGPIPGPFSMLSFALVYAGRFDGIQFQRPVSYEQRFYVELKPISAEFEPEALAVNGLDRERLSREGRDPVDAMRAAMTWVDELSVGGEPVLVAYPLSFDWTWLYWYFMRFAKVSPFNHSRCFDIKTAFAVKGHRPIVDAGRSQLMPALKGAHAHTHHAVDDAIEQAQIFANIMEWGDRSGSGSGLSRL